MRYVLAAAALLALAAGVPKPASAYVYARDGAPWCAVMNSGFGMSWDCSFASIEACRPNVLAGNRGYCNPNPWFAGAAPAVVRHPHRKRVVRHW